METDAEVWITGVVETDAEVWITGVVETDNWRQSALVLSIGVAHLGFEEITYGCITLTSLLFYFNFVCIHIYPLNTYHTTTIFLSATEDVCVLDSDWTRIRKHRGHVSTNRKIPHS